MISVREAPKTPNPLNVKLATPAGILTNLPDKIMMFLCFDYLKPLKQFRLMPRIQGCSMTHGSHCAREENSTGESKGDRLGSSYEL